MKKLTGLFLILFITLFTAETQAQLGIQAGYVHSGSRGNLELGQYGHFSGNYRNSGFQAGLTYDFNFKYNISLQTGLLYTYIGGNTTEMNKIVGNRYGSFTTNTNYQYLDLPIRVAYSLVVTNDFKFFFFAGPNLNYGLSAKMKEGNMKGVLPSGQPSEWSLSEGYDIYKEYKNELSRFDIKAGFGGGVHYKNLRMKVGYDFGFINTYTGTKIRNSAGQVNKLTRGQLTVSIGYLLWNKK